MENTSTIRFIFASDVHTPAEKKSWNVHKKNRLWYRMLQNHLNARGIVANVTHERTGDVTVTATPITHAEMIKAYCATEPTEVE